MSVFVFRDKYIQSFLHPNQYPLMMIPSDRWIGRKIERERDRREKKKERDMRERERQRER